VRFAVDMLNELLVPDAIFDEVSNVAHYRFVVIIRVRDYINSCFRDLF
jgi:hypothetical protein